MLFLSCAILPENMATGDVSRTIPSFFFLMFLLSALNGIWVFLGRLGKCPCLSPHFVRVFSEKNVTNRVRLRTYLFAILLIVLGLAVAPYCCLYGFFELYLNKYCHVSIFAKNSCVSKMSLSASKTSRNGQFSGSFSAANAFNGRMSTSRYTV